MTPLSIVALVLLLALFALGWPLKLKVNPWRRWPVLMVLAAVALLALVFVFNSVLHI